MPDLGGDIRIDDFAYDGDSFQVRFRLRHEQTPDLGFAQTAEGVAQKYQEEISDVLAALDNLVRVVMEDRRDAIDGFTRRPRRDIEGQHHAGEREEDEH